eukprot:m.98711 g.98711  ORF g.98711 m.98711 type:complete len:400 (-) comp51418_c0_seq1:91-1290(-)
MAAHVAARGVFIVAAKRTALGGFGGRLKDLTATDMAVHSTKAALAAINLDPKTVDSLVCGNVSQTSSDATYMARHIGLKSGFRIDSNAHVVNRLCGSGFQAVATAAQEILLGQSSVCVAVGSESMSQAPYVLRGTRWGTKLGNDLKLEDSLWQGLTDAYTNTPMGVTAENLAEQYKITRQEIEAFSLKSHTNWKAAFDAGRFKAEIVPITLKGKKGDEVFEVDESPRQTSLEQLAKLPTVFKKNGTVTAGSSSGINDGAASLVVVGEEALKQYNLTPLARVVGWGVAGCEPTIMGIGPVPATRALFKRSGLTVDDMDIVEVNEAFAPQCLAVAKELGIDLAKLNVDGGAIAIGHPLGMSGARILTHLTHEVKRRGGRYSLGSACIGGGQGISVILENIK